MMSRAALGSRFATIREQLARTRALALFERLSAHVRSLSKGDTAIFYALVALVGLAAVMSLYALERSLLVSVPAYGGTLVEGQVGSPRFVNPLLAITDADRDLSTLTYAGLMGVSGTGALVPVLAESYTVSPDGKAYTFVIRKDAKFSDGTPVTAADVVYTVTKAQDPALKSPEYADWSGVAVQAVDTHTVRFTLTKPYAPFLGITTLGILPEHVWQNVSSESMPFSTLETQPVGAGPFVLSSITRDSSGLISSATLNANPGYVLGRPYLDTLQFVFFARSSDLAQALASGAIDSAPGVAQGKTLTAPYARIYGVFWNSSTSKVFARTEVRKALSVAIDRAALIRSVLGGYASPVMGPVPPGSGVAQVPLPADADRVAAAAAILQKGGWTYDGDARVWKNAGAKLSLPSITIRTSNVPELKSVASAVQEAWHKLGIGVDIELYEPGDLSQNVIRPRKYEALLYGMVIGRDADLYAFWDSQEMNDPGLNIALYANKSVDALLEDARTASDPSQRASDLQKIEDTVAADYPAAFLYAPDFTYAVPTSLKGVELPQIAVSADRFASVERWYLRTDAVWPFFANRERAKEAVTPASPSGSEASTSE